MASKGISTVIGVLVILSSLIVVGADDVGGGSHTVDKGILSILEPPVSNYVPHAPIRIDEDADFDAAHGVSAGSGTDIDPWIIEGYDINGTGYGYCIYIGNTTDYFVVRDCYLHEAAGGIGEPFYPDSGLTFFYVQNGVANNNNISGYDISIYGIYLVSSSSNNKITGNNVTRNGNYGIYVFSCSNNNISNNNVSNNGDGIYLSFSPDNNITGNKASFNSNGIFFSLSDGNTAENNKVTNNWAGITLSMSGSNVLESNEALNNDHGLYVGDSSHYSGIFNNTISSNNFNGIYIDFLSAGATIYGNEISLNDDYGIYITGSVNLIYHNNFIDNANQAYDDSTNFWNDTYLSGGNYWSDFDEAIEGAYDDYNGANQDALGADGIVDSGPPVGGLNPYPNIQGGAGAQDNYPLMEEVVDGRVQRPPFRIDSNADFNAEHGVSGGSGTEADPWIIEDWDIDGTGLGYCIYIGNTTDYFEVRDCSLHDASGVNSIPYYPDCGMTLYDVQNGTIDDNNASSNDNYGIYLHNSNSNNTITNNNALSNGGWVGCGIRLDNSYNNTITNNNASLSIGIAAAFGIYLDNSNGNIIDNNTVDGSSYGGIYLYISNNNTISNNTATDNSNGIWVRQSNNNTISNNTATDNSNGIELSDSSNNTVTNNTISLNTNYGFYLSDSSNYNLIYHNNFIDNVNQAYDDSTNFWNDTYPSGGNYWSDFDEAIEGAYDDYNGANQDVAGADGIVDQGLPAGGLNPYINILGGAGAQDNYPLIGGPVVENFDIPITGTGWQFVSFPITATGDVTTVFDDEYWGGEAAVDAIKWDMMYWYDPTDASDPWKSYNKNWGGTQDMPTIDNTMGFWIHITDNPPLPGDGMLTIGEGYDPSGETVTLYQGWSLVGFPTTATDVQAQDTLPNWGSTVTKIGFYNDAQPYDITETSDGTTLMNPGNAYWVYSTIQQDWNVAA